MCVEKHVLILKCVSKCEPEVKREFMSRNTLTLQKKKVPGAAANKRGYVNSLLGDNY